MQLTELSEADQKALGLILKAAKVIDDIFYEQVLLICSLNFLFCLWTWDLMAELKTKLDKLSVILNSSGTAIQL